jgi:predicted RNA-binding Zn ribbon-like protein
METTQSFREVRIVGGNVALDFVNTQSGPRGGAPDVETLRSYDDLVAWAIQIGQLAEPEAARLLREARRDPDAAHASFDRALDLRQRLFGLFSSIAARSAPSPGALRNLTDDEADALGHADLTPGPAHLEWSWAGRRGLDRPIWPVIHGAIELVTRGPLDRVKGCGGCRFLFLDETKNKSRRWCSMDDCGSAEKMRRYVARRSAARSGGRTPAGR